MNKKIQMLTVLPPDSHTNTNTHTRTFAEGGGGGGGAVTSVVE